LSEESKQRDSSSRRGNCTRTVLKHSPERNATTAKHLACKSCFVAHDRLAQPERVYESLMFCIPQAQQKRFRAQNNLSKQYLLLQKSAKMPATVA